MPDFKTVYDEDTGAASDVTSEFYIGAVKVDSNDIQTNVGMNSGQLASKLDIPDLADRVGALETGTVPDPTSAFWNVTILDNTLTANVLVSMYTGDAWIIVKDSDTTPNDDSVGSTPPTGFTSGSTPSTYDMVTWASGELYFYQWIEGIGITEKLRQDGGRGIVVTPFDTLGPVWLSGTAGFDVDDTTFAYTIVAPIDSGTGLLSTNTYSILDNGTPILSGFTALTGTLALPERTDPYILTCQAVDNSGNTSESDQVTIDNAPTAANGTIAITAASFSATEPATIDITINWDGIGTTSIDVDTFEGTASDTTTNPTGGQFTRKSGETVNWAAPGNETVTITTFDRSSATNNQAFLQLDYDSRPANVAIGREVCEFIIDSSGSGDPGYTEQTDGTDFYIVIEAEETLGVTRHVAGDDPANTWADEADDRCLEDIRVKPNNVDDYEDSTTLDVDAPHIDYQVNLTQTGTWDCWLRAGNATGSKADKAHLALLRGVTSIGADGSGTGANQLVTLPANHGYSNGDIIYFEDASVAGYNNNTGYVISTAGTNVFDIPDTGFGAATGGNCFGEATLLGIHNASVGAGGTTFWDWVTNNSSAAQRTFDIAAAGAYVFRVYQQEYAFKYDRVCLARDISTSFDADTAEALDENLAVKGNGNDDNYGYIASTYSVGGSPIDNSENSNIYPVSLPSATVAPTTLSPQNGATANQSVVTALCANMTGLVVNDFIVTFGGSEVAGSFTFNSNSTTFTPQSGTLPPGVYVADIQGRITDTDGDVKQISIAAWTFTIVSSGSSGVIYKMDLSAYPAGTILTRTQAAVIFQNPAITNGVGSDAFDAGRIMVETDPFGSNEKVLSVQFIEGVAGHTDTGGQWKIPLGAGYDDVYLAIQYGVDNDWICPKGIHLPIITGDVWLASSEPVSGQFASFHQLGGNNTYIDSISTPIVPGLVNNSLWSYIYHQNRVRHDRYANLVDPTVLSRDSIPHPQPFLINDSYVTYESRMEMNSIGSVDGANQAWWAGNLVVDELIEWRDIAGQQVTQIIMSFHLGGVKTQPEWFGPQNQKMYIKDVTVSENPISH